MAQAKPRRNAVNDGLRTLLRSDWEKVLDEAALCIEDRTIAELYLLDAMPQVDIAAEMEVDRSTIIRRLKRIIPKVYRAACSLGLI